MGQAFFFIMLLLVVAISAVPLTNRRKRIRREDENSSGNMTITLDGCILDNLMYAKGQEVPSLGPCEKCVCEAPDVVCSMIKCQPNSGCRIKQQSGQCCPEYKCDCEYNGLLYNNGERLDKPEDPCQVCYCKGGEIMCTSITCYERDDCKPLYTAGQCCPKYDHCPVETSRSSGNSVRSVNTSLYSPKREMQPWPLTKSSSILTSVAYDESSASPNIYPQTIRIVEILPTTPGSMNKPSEVSVIPRIKTNDHSESRENQDNAKLLSSTTESSSKYTSSTAEIDHLRNTTPEIIEVTNYEPTAADVNAHLSSSTFNPLAESIDPKAQPDSYKFSTVYPNYRYTEGNINTVEQETTDVWNEPEGSGYDLLTGGIYEEFPTLETLLNNEETTTENIESVTNLTRDYIGSHEINDEPHDKVSDFPNFEAYTATEPPITIHELGHNNTISENQCDECSTTVRGELSSTSTSGSEKSKESIENSKELIENAKESIENSKESIENSSESYNEQSNENTNAPSQTEIENLNNQSLILDLDSPFIKQNSSNQRLVVENNQSDVTQSFEQLTTITTAISDLYDKTENSGISTTTEVEYSVDNTEPSEISSVSQVPDTEVTFGQQTERKRSSVGYYRNLDDDDYPKGEYPYNEQLPEKLYRSNIEDVSTNPSLISIPPVLKVHTLDYGEMSTLTENKANQNSSSMAKVGIYHPTKPNELASYLTIVDDKNNVSTPSEGTVSSHMLLTPNDLKKLAEILIHEKIKPAYPDTSTEKNETVMEKQTEKYKTSDSEGPNINKSSTASYRSFSANEKVEDVTNKTNSSFEETDGIENETKNIANNTTLNDEYVLQNISSNNESLNIMDSEDSTVTKQPDSTENNTREDGVEIGSSKEVTSAQNEIIRNFVSTVPGNQKPIKDVTIDDPNTSRQIRIPENGNQYAALLDDRDLKILENFFKKNVGLH